jgi:hypothetical protein
MRAKEFLIEANNLGVSELRAVRNGQPRYLKFLDKVKKQSPFTDKDGNPFIVDPKQYRELVNFFDDPNNQRSLILRGRDGGSLRATDLRKTQEFGGQQTAFDQTEPAGKEALPAKPSQVFQTKDIENLNTNAAKAVKQMIDAGAFYAGQLYEKITSSPVLQSAGDFGKAVINLASEINKGSMPSIKGINPAYSSALRDYSGEYLGVLAMTKNLANFPNQNQFYEFLGTNNLNDLIVWFPKATNNPLADSVAIQNKKTKHVISISSKGGTKGAPPSLDNLKVPNEFRSEPEFQEVIGFFDAAHKASAKGQPFDLINYLFSIGVDLPRYYDGILPFSNEDIGMLIQLMGPKQANARVPKKFIKIYNKFTGNTEGIGPGAVIQQVVLKDMMAAVNAEKIPNFRKLVLEILGYNFIQLFSDFKGKDKRLTVRVLWPAKVNGRVSVSSKSYAAEPGKTKLSFSIT